jgi:formylglycine-generating enzyme required for sulfatase activity
MIGKKRVLWQVAVLAGGLLVRAGAAQAESYVLPSSAFRQGANSAEYRTDVRLLNQGTSAVTVTATFYDQVTSTTVPASPFPIVARSQAAYDNILQSLFGRTLSQGAYGPIRFDTTGPIVVSTSVNNVNACKNGAVSGQWLPGIPTSQALKAGTIGQLAASSSAGAGYHTNLVFMNPGSTAATATVRVRRGGGTLLSTGTIGPLAANGFSQVALDGTVFPGVAGTTDTNLWLEFTSTQPVLAYATMIHNVSGDPFAVVATSDTPPAAGPAEITVTLPGSVPLVMVKIPAGTFQMGSPTTEKGRSITEILHDVTLTHDYYVGKYEVTQGQWQAVMGSNPPTNCGSQFYGVGASNPAYCISWNDIAGSGGFVDQLNAYLSSAGQGVAGKPYRLPTEAEWERAARGGATTQTRFSFGDALDSDDACGASAAANPYVWWCANSGGVSHAVATKGANQYGLFDMHGNVYEWVQDWLGVYTTPAPPDPTGPATGSDRVYRGGSWFAPLKFNRTASRSNGGPSYRSFHVGFRLARSL